MGLGFGFLKQMNDSVKYNRDLLGKKKSALERYKEEVKYREAKDGEQNLAHVKERIALKLTKDKSSDYLRRITSIFLTLCFLALVVWCIFSYLPKDRYRVTTIKSKIPTYKTLLLPQPNGLTLKIEQYIDGEKAAETYFKNGLKHQNSESYYETGEQFRSALYFYDTLITDIYFYRTGDTIKNFPVVKPDQFSKIKFKDLKRNMLVEFNLFDGKIVSGTYKEQKIN